MMNTKVSCAGQNFKHLQPEKIGLLRPNKKLSVFLVTGLKMLGSIGLARIIFFLPFKMHKK